MTFKPSELTAYLQQLVAQNLPISTMIWGPPGIGKSSIVAQVAKQTKLDFIDVRLSQLAPTDLRGLPVAVPPPRYWHIRHQQVRAASGSASMVKRTAPQKQPAPRLIRRFPAGPRTGGGRHPCHEPSR